MYQVASNVFSLFSFYCLKFASLCTVLSLQVKRKVSFVELYPLSWSYQQVPDDLQRVTIGDDS